MGYLFLRHPMRGPQMHNLDAPIPGVIALCLLQRSFNLSTFLLAD
jgi:hypothetical protein